MFAPFYVELHSQHKDLASFIPRTEDILIGRSSRHGRADLNIEDPYLSTEHARVQFLLPSEPLRVEEGILATLTDTSLNGTYVNSTKLTRGSTAQLRDGDTITLSKARPNPSTVPPAIGRIAFVVRAKTEILIAPFASAVSLNPFSGRQITDTMPDAYDAPPGTLWGASGAAAAGLSQCASQVPLDAPTGALSMRSLTSGLNGLRQSVISFSYTSETYRRTGDLWRDYGRLGHLGDGAYSKVWLVYSRVTGERFAAKEVLKTGTSGPVGPGTARKAAGESVDILEDEVAALSACKHPNIVRFVDRYAAPDGHTWLILELANGGEVFSKVVSKKRFQEESARKLFSQILRGVAHLHARGVVHRDIKPENVFLHQYLYTPTPEEAAKWPPGHPFSKPHARYIPKLGDFGMARIVPTGSPRLLPEVSGVGAGAGSGTTTHAPGLRVSQHATGDAGGLSRYNSIVGTAQYLCPEGYLLWKQPVLLQNHLRARHRRWRTRAQLSTLGEERGDRSSSRPLMGSLWAAGVGPVWESSFFPLAPKSGNKRPRSEERDENLEAGEFFSEEFDTKGVPVHSARKDFDFGCAEAWTQSHSRYEDCLPRVFVTASVAVWNELTVRMRQILLKVAAAREAALARAVVTAPADELRKSIVFRAGVGFIITEALLTKYDVNNRIQEALSLDPRPTPLACVKTGHHTLLRSISTFAVLDDAQARGYDGFAFDSYSLGAMLFVLLSGRHLRSDSVQEDDHHRRVSGLEQAVLGSTLFEDDPWLYVSNEARDLVIALVNPDPELRLTTAQALSHPWVLNRFMGEVPPPESMPRFASAPTTRSEGAPPAAPMFAATASEAHAFVATTNAGASSSSVNGGASNPRTTRDDLADTQAIGAKVRFPFRQVDPAPARTSRGGAARGGTGTRGDQNGGQRTVIFSPREVEQPSCVDVEAEAAADSLLEFPFLPLEA